MYFLAYLLTGIIAGTLGGLFGIGGGIIIVPMLMVVLPQVGVSAQAVMHVATATSLATIVVSTARSAYIHYYNKNIEWALFRHIIIPIMAAVIIAVIIAHHINEAMLIYSFAALLLFVAGRTFFKSQQSDEVKQSLNYSIKIPIVSSLLSAFSCMVGVSGGILLTPYFNYCGLSMMKSIGTVSVCGMVIALVATITYALLGTNLEHLPAWSVGYIYLPAFFGVIITSVIFAPIGIKLAHRLPVPQLKKLFALLLVIIAIKMIA